MNQAWRATGLGGTVAAVALDYGLTLVSFRRPVEAVARAYADIASLLAAAGHQPPSAPTLIAAVHDRVEKEVAAHETAGALEEVDVSVLERRAFADVGLNLDDETLDDCSRIAQEAWLEGVKLYGDVIPALQRLRAMGLRLGLCSNAPYRPASMRAQLRHLGLDRLFDVAVFSGEVGWRKPSPRLFAACLRGLGVGPEATVFVGDRLREDVQGAQHNGLRAVLISRGRADADDEVRATTVPEARIVTLAELPPLLAPLLAR